MLKEGGNLAGKKKEITSLSFGTRCNSRRPQTTTSARFSSADAVLRGPFLRTFGHVGETQKALDLIESCDLVWQNLKEDISSSLRGAISVRPQRERKERARGFIHFSSYNNEVVLHFFWSLYATPDDFGLFCVLWVYQSYTSTYILD